MGLATLARGYRPFGDLQTLVGSLSSSYGFTNEVKNLVYFLLSMVTGFQKLLT
jgi:hypothetical protein